MNKIQRKLNQYYEDVGIAPIANMPVTPGNLDDIFAAFRISGRNCVFLSPM